MGTKRRAMKQSAFAGVLEVLYDALEARTHRFS